MDFKKIISAVYAAAMAAALVTAVPVSAETQTKTINVGKAIGGPETNTYQISLADIKAEIGDAFITHIDVDVSFPWSETSAGWYGGGGNIGMNIGDAWWQEADGAIGCPDDHADEWTVSFDVPETYTQVVTAEDVITTSPMKNGNTLSGDEWGAATGDWTEAK